MSEYNMKINVKLDAEGRPILNLDIGPVGWKFILSPEKADSLVKEFNAAVGMLENFIYLEKAKEDRV